MLRSQPTAGTDNNAHRKPRPITVPGNARGYSARYFTTPRNGNDERYATSAHSAMKSVAIRPPTAARNRLLRIDTR